MPEPNGELETLRRTVGELTQKSATRKKRIEELEASVADLQTKLTASNGALHQIRVEQPLQLMAESISTIPEVFTREFQHHFKLEFADGKLSFLTADGKPVVDAKGAPVPFERNALAKFLAEGEDVRAKTFRTFLVGSKATGAGGATQVQQKPATQQQQPIHFGIR